MRDSFGSELHGRKKNIKCGGQKQMNQKNRKHANFAKKNQLEKISCIKSRNTIKKKWKHIPPCKIINGGSFKLAPPPEDLTAATSVGTKWEANWRKANSTRTKSEDNFLLEANFPVGRDEKL